MRIIVVHSSTLGSKVNVPNVKYLLIIHLFFSGVVSKTDTKMTYA